LIKSDTVVETLLQYGFNFYTGVPCSYLKPLINRIVEQTDVDYVGACSEGESMGIAAGAYFGGKHPVVLAQNSGLGNLVNPLTSLANIFKIPVLLLITHRGDANVKPDEPQHEQMGMITTDLLDVLQIPWAVFPKVADELKKVVSDVALSMDNTKLPFALIVKRDTFEAYEQSQDKITASQKYTRIDAIQKVLMGLNGDELVVASTGKIGRELYELSDRKQNLYIVGSMGCASAVGLGLALARPERKVIVLDGDGAALMKLGNLATIGANVPFNYYHVLLDNGVHESTGGQATVSDSIDWTVLTKSIGYQSMLSTDELSKIPGLVKALLDSSGPTMLHLKVNSQSNMSVGRPKISPEQVKQRFMEYLGI